MEAFLIIWIIGIVLAVLIGHVKGRTKLGLVVGILFGWLGVLGMAFLAKSSSELDQRGATYWDKRKTDLERLVK